MSETQILFCSQCGSKDNIYYTIFDKDLICSICWKYKRMGSKDNPIKRTEHFGDIDP